MTKPKLTLLLLGLILSYFSQAQEGNSLFDPTYVHEVRLYFFEDNYFENMDSLWDVHHEASGINVPYSKAYLQIDGNWLDTVGIRIKGLSSYYKANSKKKGEQQNGNNHRTEATKIAQKPTFCFCHVQYYFFHSVPQLFMTGQFQSRKLILM